MAVSAVRVAGGRGLSVVKKGRKRGKWPIGAMEKNRREGGQRGAWGWHFAYRGRFVARRPPADPREVVTKQSLYSHFTFRRAGGRLGGTGGGRQGSTLLRKKKDNSVVTSGG